MPDTILLEVQSPTIPADFCPTGTSQEQWQQVADAILLGARFTIPVNTRFINFGPITPAAAFRPYPWLNTTDGLMYQHTGGYWLAPHEDAKKVISGQGHTIIAPPGIATQGAVETYQGGEAGVATPIAGPFWTIDPDFIGRIPIGAGLIPGSNPPTTLYTSDTFGLGSHIILQSELPATLALQSVQFGHRYNPENLGPLALAPRGSGSGGLDTTPATEQASYNFTNTGGGTPMSMMPPVSARLLLRKTVRIWYRLPE